MASQPMFRQPLNAPGPIAKEPPMSSRTSAAWSVVRLSSQPMEFCPLLCKTKAQPIQLRSKSPTPTRTAMWSPRSGWLDEGLAEALAVNSRRRASALVDQRLREPWPWMAHSVVSVLIAPIVHRVLVLRKRVFCWTPSFHNAQLQCMWNAKSGSEALFAGPESQFGWVFDRALDVCSCFKRRPSEMPSAIFSGMYAGGLSPFE